MKKIIVSHSTYPRGWSNEGILAVLRRKGFRDEDLHCFRGTNRLGWRMDFESREMYPPMPKEVDLEVFPKVTKGRLGIGIPFSLVFGDGLPYSDRGYALKSINMDDDSKVTYYDTPPKMASMENTFSRDLCLVKWREDPDAISVLEELTQTQCNGLYIREFDDTAYDYRIVRDDMVGEVVELYPKIKWNKEALS